MAQSIERPYTIAANSHEIFRGFLNFDLILTPENIKVSQIMQTFAHNS